MIGPRDDDHLAVCPWCSTTYDRGDWGPDWHMMNCPERPPERIPGPAEARVDEMLADESSDEFIEFAFVHADRSAEGARDPEQAAQELLRLWDARRNQKEETVQEPSNEIGTKLSWAVPQVIIVYTSGASLYWNGRDLELRTFDGSGTAQKMVLCSAPKHTDMSFYAVHRRPNPPGETALQWTLSTIADSAFKVSGVVYIR